MIICKQCLKGDEPYKEAEFDYRQRFDVIEDFDDPHGRYCDIFGINTIETDEKKFNSFMRKIEKGHIVLIDNKTFCRKKI